MAFRHWRLFLVLVCGVLQAVFAPLVQFFGGEWRAILQTERPGDLWVFRSTLDGNTGVLTAALLDSLWAAYDTDHGRLYKAWYGIVEFNGVVYTAAHGPHPMSEGQAYLVNPTKADV